jgi:hypothetical protein
MAGLSVESGVDPKEKLSLVDVAEIGCEYSERLVD